ncbi:hypothetical protein [Paenibacillus sp. PL2-23]
MNITFGSITPGFTKSHAFSPIIADAMAGIVCYDTMVIIERV